jgi:hypothetical protein
VSQLENVTVFISSLSTLGRTVQSTGAAQSQTTIGIGTVLSSENVKHSERLRSCRLRLDHRQAAKQCEHESGFAQTEARGRMGKLP